MGMKSIYISEDDESTWSEVVKLAKEYDVSVSKVVIGELKKTLRERQGVNGVPLGFSVPASMKDPRVVRAEQTADMIRERVLQAMLSEIDTDKGEAP